MARRKPQQTEETPDEPTPKRNRYAWDAQEGIPEALERRAAKLTIQRKRRVTITEVINEILLKDLASELRELREDK